jgi:Phosphodiester glycosidase
MRMRMRALWRAAALAGVCLTASCGGAPAPVVHHRAPPTASPPAPSPPAGAGKPAAAPGSALSSPAPLASFGGPARGGAGRWRPAGRAVDGLRAVYQTTLVPPGGTEPAGIAWMNTRLLAARLYSGSKSPGGEPYRFTAPVKAAQASTLVAAFNGGFLMKDARGGYYTQGRTVDPLRRGAASLVIYTDGSVGIGAWGRDVRMTPNVVSVRQNLVPLVAGGRPTPQAAGARWQAWGSTCGAASCAASVPGIEHQWRSALGITADGALVYAAGPGLDPLQLAELLVRAGVVRGMQLDINPDWPVFVSYDPRAGGLAAPSNGRKLLAATVQGPSTFFEAWWARDFVTMSARRLHRDSDRWSAGQRGGMRAPARQLGVAGQFHPAAGPQQRGPGV